MKSEHKRWCKRSCSMFEYCVKDGTEYLSPRCKNISSMTDGALVQYLKNHSEIYDEIERLKKREAA